MTWGILGDMKIIKSEKNKCQVTSMYYAHIMSPGAFVNLKTRKIVTSACRVWSTGTVSFFSIYDIIHHIVMAGDFAVAKTDQPANNHTTCMYRMLYDVTFII